MDAQQIEERRFAILDVLAGLHPLAIFHNLAVDESIAFTLSEKTKISIQNGLSHPQRRRNESVGLGTVKIAGKTPDDLKIVYEMSHFEFMDIGGKDSVMAIERDLLNPGEVEIHTHLPSAPDFLGYTDVGDLIAVIEGSAWVHPTTKLVQPHLRFYGIISIYGNRQARFDFYSHNLMEALSVSNNYGLKRAGLPLVIDPAY